MRLAITLFFVVIASTAFAQKQLVLLDRQTVLLRLSPGDDIVFRVKGDRQKHRSYVNNLSDTAVVIHSDTIAFADIERLYFRRVTFWNRLGGYLTFAGVGLFAIDQLNNSVVRGNDFDIDRGLTIGCATAVGVGLPLFLIRKKSTVLDGRRRLMMVSPGSPFYQGDRRKGYVSPYIPQ